MKHAKLSASGSERWLNCPASVALIAKLPKSDESSIYANEGSVAHELGEMALAKKIESTYDMVGKVIKLDNGYEQEVDEDMAQYVDRYIAYVDALNTLHDTELLVEQRVCYDNWVKEGFGTSDAIVLDPDNGVVHIIDLKYGKGEKVFAKDNTQAQLYALGVIQTSVDNPDLYRKIHIHIVQPRIQHFDVWKINMRQLLEFGGYAKERAELCFREDAPFGPTDKGCRWCPLAPKCSALAEHNLKVISDEFDTLEICLNEEDLRFKDKELLSPQQIANLIPKLTLIEKWCKQVAEGALEDLLNGYEVPGYKAVEGRSNRSWTKLGEEQVVEKLGDAAYQPAKVLSPAQAEKVLKKDKLKLEADWVFKKPGKPTLAVEADKRPPIASTADEFDEVK